MKFVSAGSLLLAMAGLGVTACTDYTEIVESEYGYLREDPSASDEDCKENCGSKEEGSGKSSSSTKGGTGSSGSTSAGSTSVEVGESNPTCENQAFTMEHALPLRKWGFFGYVIPLKITKGDTQELYLSLGKDVSGIQGPDAWDSYGVTLGQVDETNNWKFGTEIFSKNTRSALPGFGVNYSIRGVYTYGRYVKFEFDTKGTWLEKNAGKTINVGVNFYAPGVKSDSSGMGVDYYSIPSPDTSGLYYAYEDMGCSAYPSSTISNIHCYASPASVAYTYPEYGSGTGTAYVHKKDTMQWRISATNYSFWWDSLSYRYADITWNFENGSVVSQNKDEAKIVYDTYGSAGGFATLEGYGFSFDIPCDSVVDGYYKMDVVMVGEQVKGCECTADTNLINVASNEYATYTYKECTSPTIAEYKWNTAFTPSSSDEHAALISMEKTGQKNVSLTVVDSDGYETVVSCPILTGYDPDQPDYILPYETATTASSLGIIENIRYNILFECDDNEYYSKGSSLSVKGVFNNEVTIYLDGPKGSMTRTFKGNTIFSIGSLFGSVCTEDFFVSVMVIGGPVTLRRE